LRRQFLRSTQLIAARSGNGLRRASSISGKARHVIDY